MDRSTLAAEQSRISSWIGAVSQGSDSRRALHYARELRRLVGWAPEEAPEELCSFLLTLSELLSIPESLQSFNFSATTDSLTANLELLSTLGEGKQFFEELVGFLLELNGVEQDLPGITVLRYRSPRGGRYGSKPMVELQADSSSDCGEPWQLKLSDEESIRLGRTLLRIGGTSLG